ncbi:MAG TPA: carboxypeptidase-like regulatory domain-containing protein [Candidatus Angelobacter sp.]
MKRSLLALMLIVSVSAMAGENATLPLPSAGNVTLPIAEYNKLLDLVRNPARKPEPPPLPYSIQRADLKFRVAQESVLGTVQLDGEVFKKGATKVPLTSGMTILDAHQQSKALPLEQEGVTSTAILPGPAEFSVTLDAGLPLTIEAGRASFKLPVPSAGSVQATLVIPGEHTNIRINPGLITARTSANGQTTIEATLVPGQPASIWWTTREVATPVAPKEVRFLSDVKTLISVNEADLRIAVLADVTVVQGEPSEFAVQLPEGYEVTGTSAATVESSEARDGTLVLKLNGAHPRSHQFLITMEKPISATKADAPFVSFKNAQRETGEVLVEGTGAMELTAKESGGLKRLDVKEVNANLRALARFPLQAAFRYHRQPAETPALSLDWVRFPDSPVLAAVADWAIVTTLVTSEGRSLTEVKLVLKNQAQPFLKIDLPAGATILSADVAGERVKPVQAPDGSRIPLLRPGFRPTGSYTVSFVFLHSGSPFAKKGGSELTLPKMDLPISVLQWEVFLPEQYKVKDFGGDAISANMQAVVFDNAASFNKAIDVGVGAGIDLTTKSGTNTFAGVTLQNFAGVQENEGLDRLALFVPGVVNSESLVPGQIAGFVVDPQGVAVPTAQITIIHPESGVTQTVVADSSGRWVASNVPSGQIKITASVPGFKTSVRDLSYDANKVAKLNVPLSVANTSETVEVRSKNTKDDEKEFDRRDREAKKTEAMQQNAASSNVFNLQKRVAGVLPVSVDVPHAGNSYRFVRPLVLDEETRLTFNYKTTGK